MLLCSPLCCMLILHLATCIADDSFGKNLRSGKLKVVKAAISLNFDPRHEWLNIMELLVSTDPELVTLLKHSSQKDGVTAFAPWDSAFKRPEIKHMFPKLLEEQWRAHRKDFILFHFHVGTVHVPSDSDLPVKNLSITMMNTEQVEIAFEPLETLVNGVTVLASNQTKEIGPVFMLQEALGRPWHTNTVWDSFSTRFSRLVVMAGLEDDLRDKKGAMTLFVPPDNKLDEYHPESLPNQELISLLRFHMISGRVLSLDELSATPGRVGVKNDAGQTLVFDSLGGGTTVDGMLLLFQHQELALNGIVHRIDDVLPQQFIPPLLRENVVESDPAHQSLGLPGDRLSAAGVGAF